MKTSEELSREAQLNRQFVIRVRRSLSPWSLFPWWATMTQGFVIGDGLWRARSREKLIKKCERRARRMARSQGIPPEEIAIKVKDVHA